MVHSQLNYLMKLVIKFVKLVMNMEQLQEDHAVLVGLIAVVIRHARRVSGLTDLTLNSIDVLSGLETVKICTAYKYQGETNY